jgi:hypothetical protein
MSKPRDQFVTAFQGAFPGMLTGAILKAWFAVRNLPAEPRDALLTAVRDCVTARRIEDAHSVVSAKGKPEPEAQVTFNANAQPSAFLRWKKIGGGDWDYTYEHFRADSVAEVTEAMRFFIASMPEAKIARLHDFMKHLGSVIDTGRSLGIDIEYINPLTETMKRLSENALTRQPA